MKSKISITIDENTLNEIDSTIDNFHVKNRSRAIEALVNKTLNVNKSAVILCGGPEQSLKISETEYRPTAMIGSKSLIELQINKLKYNGFRDVFIVARGDVLTSIFNILKDGSDFGIKVQYIDEKKSDGSFDSLMYVNGKVYSNFLVVYGDLYFDNVNIEELWNHHIKNHSLSTIMMTTSSTPSEKGTLKVEGTRVLEFTQKPNRSDIYLVFSPIFICSPEIFDYRGKSIENDIFPQLAKKALLEGYLTSEKEIHIHEKKDVKKIK